MKTTTKTRVERFLVEALKKEQVKRASTKYKKYIGSSEGSFYFVGKKGAVRSGKNLSESISITDKVHANMKIWEKKNNL